MSALVDAINVKDVDTSLRLIRESAGDLAVLDFRLSLSATPLMKASGYGLNEVVKALIAAKASLDLQDKYGRTALHRAAVAGQVEAVRLLVEGGASTKLKSRDGFTALARARKAVASEDQKATQSNKSKVVDVLRSSQRQHKRDAVMRALVLLLSFVSLALLLNFLKGGENETEL